MKVECTIFDHVAEKVPDSTGTCIKPVFIKYDELGFMEIHAHSPSKCHYGPCMQVQIMPDTVK